MEDSGGGHPLNQADGTNYFGIGVPTGFSNGMLVQNPGFSVLQAYNIDKKIDDGYPQTGSVTAMYLNDTWNTRAAWAANGAAGAPDTSATAGSTTTCYDNSATTSGTPGVAGATQHYSTEMNNGNSVNCALSFRFQ
jgi:hypothetical protein